MKDKASPWSTPTGATRKVGRWIQIYGTIAVLTTYYAFAWGCVPLPGFGWAVLGTLGLGLLVRWIGTALEPPGDED